MSAAEKESGGPAFPTLVKMLDADGKTVTIADCRDGMTLRDWFAGKAMAAFLANDPDSLGAVDIADCAYDQADAMLAARSA